MCGVAAWLAAVGTAEPTGRGRAPLPDWLPLVVIDRARPHPRRGIDVIDQVDRRTGVPYRGGYSGTLVPLDGLAAQRIRLDLPRVPVGFGVPLAAH